MSLRYLSRYGVPLAFLCVLLARWNHVSEWLEGSSLRGRPETVTEWIGTGTPEFEYSIATVFEDLHPEISVRLFPVEAGSRQNILYASFISGNPPDVVSVPAEDIRGMVARGMLRPLDDMLERSLREDPEFLDKLPGGKGSLTYFTVDQFDPMLQDLQKHPVEAARLLAMHGKLVGIQQTDLFDVLVWNKRVFREVAKDNPNTLPVDQNGDVRPPSTWSEFIAVAHLIASWGKDRGIAGLVVPAQRPRDLMRFVRPLAATAGSMGFNFRGRPWIDGMSDPVGCYDHANEGLLGTVKLLLTMAEDQCILAGSATRHFEECRALLAQGRAAMLIDRWHAAPVGVDRFPSAKDDIGCGAIPLPDRDIENSVLGFPVGRGAPYRTVGGLVACVTTTAGHPHAAWLWTCLAEPELEKASTRRGALPRTTAAAARLKDTNSCPFPFQEQLWALSQQTRLWPEVPVHGPVPVSSAEETIRAAFLNAGRAKTQALMLEVEQGLRNYDLACNRDLSRRVQGGASNPSLWTFPEWDATRPERSAQEQQARKKAPAVRLALESLQARLHSVRPSEAGGTPAQQGLTVSGRILALLTLALALLFSFRLARRLTKPPNASSKYALTDLPNLGVYLFVLPMVLLISCFILYPAAYQVWLSLHSGQGIELMDYSGGRNYGRLFQDRSFWCIVLPNTIQYMLAVPLAQIAIGLPIAVLLTRTTRLSAVQRFLVFAPMSTSIAAVSVVLIGLLSGPDSGLNRVLEMLGLQNLSHWCGLAQPGVRLDWLGDSRTDLPCVIAVAVWHGLPFVMLLILAALQGIPREIYEAATVDGASAWKHFTCITLPSVLPVLVVVFLVSMLDTARAFSVAYVLTGGGTRHSSELVSTYIYKWGFTQQPGEDSDLGYACAVGVGYSIMLLPLALCTAVLLRKHWQERLSSESG